MKKNCILKSFLLLCLLWVGIGSVNAQTYVKWKLVDGINVTLTTGDVAVIVDQTSGLAMSNDKDDKDPDAVAVALNYDKDRLTGEVPENVQWTYTAASGGHKFTTGEKTLYADSKGLKTGTGTDNVFDITTIDGVGYLHIAVSGKDYLAGVEESMFSNSWKLKELKDGQPDDAVADTRIAIFKKVDDTQKVITLTFPSDNYEINSAHNLTSPNIVYAKFDPAEASDNAYTRDIEYSSSKPSVIYPVKMGDTNVAEDPHGDRLCLGNSGTAKFIARIQETPEYDKAVTYCTIRYNNTWEDFEETKGSKTNPLTVSEAIRLAKGETVDGVTYEEDRCYFIKGKVNKVNSGMMAMFGDFGLDEMMGDDMDMDERMGDMDDFDMSEMGDMMGGIDMASMIPGFGNSDGLTYYISDDGTKDNRMKVTNGHGLVQNTEGSYAVSFEELDDLSPGDDVLVYGPLVLSEDDNMFASLFGGSGGIGGIGQDNSDYEWAPTSLDELNTDDVVLLVDKNNKIALNTDVKGTTVKINKDKIADNVATNIQWTLMKNDDGTLTFTTDNTPLSVTRDFTLTVGQGQSSEFTYNNGYLGIEYSSGIGRYIIKWNKADGSYSALFESTEASSDYINADFTFYKRVEKTEEDNSTVKVGELNYLHELSKTLIVQDQHLYTGYEKKLPQDQEFFYTINSTPLIPVTGDIQTGKIKSADEEIAKWVIIAENVDSTFTAVNPGTTKITVKVKVIVSPAEGDEKEKSYTMKRKFNLEVRSRDKEPEGKNVGEYVLVESTDELEDGTRMLIIGTRTKADTENNTETKTKYALGANNTMMGGGKEGKKVDDDRFSTSKEGNRECIKYEDVPDGVQEIILEKADDTSWYLNVGKDENGNKLYLYASVKEKTEGSGSEGSGNSSGSGFNMDEMMEMFMPSSGLKVGTKDGTRSKTEGVDSLKATVSISGDIATIKYPAIADEDDKNTIVLTSSFDMESMMSMFSSEEEGGEEGGNSFDMGSFDMFMASFNTKKPADIDEKKAFTPRIFAFVQYDEYPVNIGDAEWMTIVSDYDVTPADDVEAYVVTNVTADNTQGVASLKGVESLKGGEPYLLHSPKGNYIMTRTSDVTAPDVNLLEVSDGDTEGVVGNTSVYVLANKTSGVGFYKWTGGKLGTGRVYLPVAVETSTVAGDFIIFGEEATAIETARQDGAAKKASYFNLSGQRVSTPSQKGIYITDGKKVVIK